MVTRVGYLCSIHSIGIIIPRTTKPRRPKLPAGKFRTGHGYVMVWTEPRFPGSRPHGSGWAILEHHKVMGEMIGRALLPGESVKFINDVRGDSRPENLELWRDGKPVADQVKWAKQIISWYDD